MSTTWFTSDLHFGHTNVIQLSGRPFLDYELFPDLEKMHNTLIARWNSVVSKDDKVYILGDLTLAGNTATQAILDTIVPQLNGMRPMPFMLGNHDRPFLKEGSRNKEHAKQTKAYEAAGFQIIPQRGPYGLKIDGKYVRMSHFPYNGDHSADLRYPEDRPVDKGEWLLHGHVHEAWRQRGRQINVGVDAWGGYPVNIEVISALIERGPQNLDALDWV